MTPAVAILNLFLGVAYLGIGVMAVIDLKRGWHENGFSHFGLAFAALAFTCGPHHLTHGLHIAIEGRAGGALDLVAVAIGLPAGVIWLLLRIEAFVGGRGDRFISGTPPWLLAIPILGSSYLTLMIAGGLRASSGIDLSMTPAVIPNLSLIVIYAAIGYSLMRAQVRNREPQGGWSVSGVSLTMIFPTCALMHAAYALYTTTGLFEFDIHAFVIDWASIPAGVYFLWVVRSLASGSLIDWNETGERQQELAMAT